MQDFQNQVKYLKTLSHVKKNTLTDSESPAFKVFRTGLTYAFILTKNSRINKTS